MKEAHNSPYTVHPESTKIYRDLRGHSQVAKHEKINRCVSSSLSHMLSSKGLTSKRRPTGLLRPLPIPE